MSKITYKLELATYPTQYEQCVVSENKICLQFDTTEMKVRAPHEKRKILYNNLGALGDYLPIRTVGDDLEGLNVGLVLPVLRQAQFGLLSAYKEHMQKYPGKLKPMLEDMKKEIEAILQECK